MSQSQSFECDLFSHDYLYTKAQLETLSRGNSKLAEGKKKKKQHEKSAAENADLFLQEC